eukprot:7387344-Prymnesium_polylepis.2
MERRQLLAAIGGLDDQSIKDECERVPAEVEEDAVDDAEHFVLAGLRDARHEARVDGRRSLLVLALQPLTLGVDHRLELWVHEEFLSQRHQLLLQPQHGFVPLAAVERQVVLVEPRVVAAAIGHNVRQPLGGVLVHAVDAHDRVEPTRPVTSPVGDVVKHVRDRCGGIVLVREAREQAEVAILAVDVERSLATEHRAEVAVRTLQRGGARAVVAVLEGQQLALGVPPPTDALLLVLDREADASVGVRRSLVGAGLQRLQHLLHALAAQQRVVPALALLHAPPARCKLIRRQQHGSGWWGGVDAVLGALQPRAECVQLRLAEEVQAEARPFALQQLAQRHQLEAQQRGDGGHGRPVDRGDERSHVRGGELVRKEHRLRLRRPALGEHRVWHRLEAGAVRL